MKNRSLEVFTKIYKPYRITKLNNTYILNTMDGDFAIKLNPKIDYNKLYRYLYSRGFNYIPDISLDSRDDMIVFKYQEDTNIDNDQKILDLISIVSLLHNKTSYYKDVTLDKYKEVYINILENLEYIDRYYDNMFNEFIKHTYNSPSEYLFLRNYTIIYNAINYCKNLLNEWFILVQNKTRERVCLIHNNLKLEHFLKNKEEYLISWDNYSYDTPVLDIFNLYKNEWENVSFVEVINSYNSSFNLLQEENMLFNILISIPFKIEVYDSEYELCRNIRKLINYLDKSSKILINT